MRITKAEFITSLNKYGAFPGRGLPEIALAGRSNVGKSSLINTLCRNSRLAHTSSEPGKTRLINIYRVRTAGEGGSARTEEFFLTDLPGYGFARASGDERRRWQGMIEGYLTGSDKLIYALLLVDSRHEPTDDDRQMAEYLRGIELPFCAVATKTDKLSKAQLNRSLPLIYRKLVIQPWQLVTWSSETGAGRDKLLGMLESVLHPAKAQDDGIILPEGLTFEDGPVMKTEE